MYGVYAVIILENEISVKQTNTVPSKFVKFHEADRIKNGATQRYLQEKA
jgi:hypothetical protein